MGVAIEREVIAVVEKPVVELPGERVPDNASEGVEATMIRQFATRVIKI